MVLAFEKLRVYNDAQGLVIDIYHTTRRWPQTERFALCDQLHRAAVSIVLNIAEGASRKGKEFGRFLDISRGSCYECIAILGIANKLEYMDNQNYEKCIYRLEGIIRQIITLNTKVTIQK